MKTLVPSALACLLYASASSAAPVQWTAGAGANGHWYEFVTLTAPVTATDAETAAESSVHQGQNGYLATITSAEEQAFLNTLWPGAGSVLGQFSGFSYFLIGASDRDSEGTFEWIGGPEDGSALSYSNWSSGEPNDANGEDYVVAWWQDSVSGVWNDVPDTGVFAYVVEYPDAPVSAVPVPAGLPMLLGALGVLAAFRRRKPD